MPKNLTIKEPQLCKIVFEKRRLVSGLAHIRDIMPQIPQTLSDLFFHFTYKHSINFFTFSSFFCELIHKLLPTSGEGETETLAMRNEYIHVCFLIHYLLLLLQLRFFNKLTELVIMNVGFLCTASQRLSQAMK